MARFTHFTLQAAGAEHRDHHDGRGLVQGRRVHHQVRAECIKYVQSAPIKYVQSASSTRQYPTKVRIVMFTISLEGHGWLI